MPGDVGAITAELRALGARLSGDVVVPSDDGWDEARQAWNLAVDQRPLAVVFPASADDVVATVAFAGEHGARIAFNGGGHNAAPIDWTEDTLLMKTERPGGNRDRSTGTRVRAWSPGRSGSRWPWPPASTASPFSPEPRPMPAWPDTCSAGA